MTPGWWARLGLSPSAYVGLALLLLFVLAGLFGPVLAPYPADLMALENEFAPSSAAHWLGTDQHGADLLSQLLHGARLALIISASVVSICAVVGVILGVVAGYYGGPVDEVLMRVVDILMAFPGILLNIAIVATMAEPGVGVLIFALCLNGWVGYARLARGQVLSLREREYVVAARCVGAGSWRIMRRHIIPNLLSPIMVQMTFGFGGVILVEASLSFLGLGPQVEYTWGALLDQGTTFLWRPGAELFALAPGAAIMAVVLGANLLGDGLRDRFDPRRSRRR
ncbi:ABC transporter permease [Haliangium sp.]|uniref:ABC transporter permease n=1 Tax=Haliangium sp. TaxID=2663208 RepID=UPI003D144320